MRPPKLFLLLFLFSTFPGCGHLASSISGKPCPYGGVQTDLAAMVHPKIIIESYGAIIPLAIIDMPASFALDTLKLGETIGKECPAWF